MSIPLPIPQSIAPTDNLYKFMAIFGLTLIVVAAIMMGIRAQSHNEKVLNLRVNTAEMKALADKTSDIAMAWQQTLIALKSALQPILVAATHPSVSSENLSAKTNQEAKNLESFINQTEALTKLANDLETKRRGLITTTVVVEVDAEIMKGNMSDLMALFVVGLFLSILGFVSWYFLLQKPQDQLLRTQVEFELKKLRGFKTEK